MKAHFEKQGNKEPLPLGLNGMYLLLFWTEPNPKATKAHETTDLQYITDYFADWEKADAEVALAKQVN